MSYKKGNKNMAEIIKFFRKNTISQNFVQAYYRLIKYSKKHKIQLNKVQYNQTRVFMDLWLLQSSCFDPKGGRYMATLGLQPKDKLARTKNY